MKNGYRKGRRYRVKCLFCAFALFGPVVGFLSAQQSSVTQVGIATFDSSDDARLQAAAESISSTIGLSLRLLERYEVQQIGSWTYDGGSPPQAVHLRGLDFIMFGSVQDRSGDIVLDLSVYSRAENGVTGRHQDTVRSVFDLFDASDEAAIALLESLSGEVIRFATLRLRNGGNPGDYAVFVDDVPVGRNLSELRVLVGSRSVRITQQRMFSDYTVYEGRESLQDGAVQTIEFHVPLATPDERRALVDIEERILENLQNPAASAVVDQLFARAFFLLDDISYSPGLAEYRKSFEALRDAPVVYTERAEPEAPRHRVGDRGPAGGIVFYDKGRVSDGWRYLEAAPEDLAGGERMNWNDAMSAAGNFRFGGFSDWRLPTKDELNRMYENLHKRNVGGFASGHYWSSSEFDSGSAWRQAFVDGAQNNPNKNSSLRVRAVRAF